MTNAFLRTKKFVEHYEWLKKAAGNLGIRLDLMENADKLLCIGDTPEWLGKYDFIIFWDKDISYGKVLSQYADIHRIPVYNTVDAVAACDDKFETYYRLAKFNAAHPGQRVSLLPTVMAPMTYLNIGYTTLDFLGEIETKLGYPMVVKECFGSFGMQVYLAKDREELEELTIRLAGVPFLYQKYASYSSGRDVRLQVVGNRVVAAMERYSEQGDFRANLTKGGSMKPYLATEEEEELAVRVAGILGLDFAGVDLLFSEKTGRADIVCEVNSNAHFKNIHTCTGVNVAEEIMGYILQKLDE